MRFELGLTQRLGLEMHLTPQLILNLKLLQVPTIELEALIRKEMEENPVLEQVDDSEYEDSGNERQPERAAEPAGDAQVAPDGQLPEGEERPAEVTPVDKLNIADFFPDDGFIPGSLPQSRGDSEVDVIELAEAPGPDLRGALMPMLRSVLTEDDARIAEAIIEMLDGDGFLTVDMEELATSQGVEPGRLRDILHPIQRFEPGGIGCRNQQEAFLVQLELQGYSPACLECLLVSQHWKLLLQAQVKKIARLCGVTQKGVRHAIETILTLEPRPARQFSRQMVEYVLPDFSVDWRDDKPVAVPNDGRQPRLRLARRYVEMLRKPKVYPREQVRFAREKFNRALMFLRGIESRRRTLKRLMDLILDEQHEFFVSGPQYLKPATLRAAAGKLGVHPSTASRATAGKYVETSYGIFPLKHFFKAGTGAKSRASIKRKVQLIVENENKAKPLSDDEIGGILAREGIKIARRTVAKYRNELRIPGRNQRGRL